MKKKLKRDKLFQLDQSYLKCIVVYGELHERSSIYAAASGADSDGC